MRLARPACVSEARKEPAAKSRNRGRADADNVEQLSEILYYAGAIGGLPALFAVEIVAVFMFSGWQKLLVLAPGAYVGYLLFEEFGPGISDYMNGGMDRAEFRRFIFEHWSIMSRPALGALGIVLAMVVARALIQRRRLRTP